jgi:hypothetical protein
MLTVSTAPTQTPPLQIVSNLPLRFAFAARTSLHSRTDSAGMVVTWDSDKRKWSQFETLSPGWLIFVTASRLTRK